MGMIRGATHKHFGSIRRADDRNAHQLLHAVHFVQQSEQDALVRTAVDGRMRA